MNFISSPGLYTDMYQLIMAQGYLSTNKAHLPTTFDYFFRKNPFEGGYTIFAGLKELLNILPSFKYTDEDTAYLFSLGNFTSSFLGYLNNFKFTGNIFSVKEGEVVFPNEPLMRVEGTWLECQLLETLLLNIVNFESLIATKAARLRQVAGSKIIIDMGLRRAQGMGGLWASRASIIGGVNSTSNVLSAKNYDLTPTGTMAHSWIQGHDSELEAFRQFAKVYPDSTTLLVDTYNTLKSGVPNAIIVAKDMEKDGHKLKGVRLDSGDFAYLSKKTRQLLDNAGLQYVRIVVSNQLDEYVIRSLEEQKAPIDVFGVGTNLAVGAGAGAHDGVYKLSSCGHVSKMKLSENISKQSLPGPKDIFRFYADDMFYADGITKKESKPPEAIFDPIFTEKSSSTWQLKSEPLLQQFVKNGEVITSIPSTTKSAEYVSERLKLLSAEHKRFENPHIYKVGISQMLMKLRDEYVKAYSQS